MSVAGLLLFVCLLLFFVVVVLLCFFGGVVLFCFVFSGRGSGLGFFVGVCFGGE